MTRQQGCPAPFSCVTTAPRWLGERRLQAEGGSLSVVNKYRVLTEVSELYWPFIFLGNFAFFAHYTAGRICFSALPRVGGKVGISWGCVQEMRLLPHGGYIVIEEV